MKKKNLLFLIFVFCEVHSQNLVVNPSFENFIICPTNEGQIQNAQGWHRTPSLWVNTPDLFQPCSSSAYVDVPINAVGNQLAFDGEGYAGLFITDIASHEYMYTVLPTPLIANQNYQVSFYVSCADNFWLASNNIGALFSTSPLYVDFTGVINQPPHVNASTVISNTNEWTQISGIYQANGGENHLTIGNFFSDDETQHVISNASADESERTYYYIDMISVIPTTLGRAENLLSSFTLFPNPCEDKLYLEYSSGTEHADIQINNTIGQLVKSYSNAGKELDLTEIESGLYILVATVGNKNVRRKFTKQ